MGFNRVWADGMDGAMIYHTDEIIKALQDKIGLQRQIIAIRDETIAQLMAKIENKQDDKRD